jgi:hypothetical protein
MAWFIYFKRTQGDATCKMSQQNENVYHTCLCKLSDPRGGSIFNPRGMAYDFRCLIGNATCNLFKRIKTYIYIYLYNYSYSWTKWLFWPIRHDLYSLNYGPQSYGTFKICKRWALLFQKRKFLVIFCLTILCKWPIGRSLFWPQVQDLHMFGRCPLRNTACQISKL